MGSIAIPIPYARTWTRCMREPSGSVSTTPWIMAPISSVSSAVHT